MSVVVTFEGYTPAPRFDGIPWTEARIEEATSSGGTYAQIDVIALVPVDSDPANPETRNLTTANGTAQSLWYRIIFADAGGNTCAPTSPVQNLPDGAAVTGPVWITGADVAECCGVEDGSDPTIFDAAAELASQLLYQYSLRRFAGIQETTVRPCRTGCGCPWQVLSRGYVIWNPNITSPWWGYWSCGDGDWCGCGPLSKVLLAGHVTSITEVLIDGDPVDPDTYRVDQNRWLVRTRPDADDDQNFWPGCQNMDLPEDQPGTWAVTYTYGREVPVSGQNAAAELACEIYKQCNRQPCALPSSTIRVARQGIVVEKPSFLTWAFEKGGRSIPRGWKTGMPNVDAFLNAFNPTGLVRVPIIWSPTARLRYAPTLGLSNGS